MKKPNLICLHGALGCAAQMQAALQKLTSAYTLHFLDFPGHGKRAHQNISIENCVAAARDFIRERDLHSATIFGYSMGGYVALLLAKKHPECVGQIITLGTKLHWTETIASLETQKLNPEIIVEKVPKYAEMLRSWHGNNWRQVLSQTANLMRDLGKKPRLIDDVYQQIMHPVLLLLAENDNMVTKEETMYAANLLPFGEFKSLPNAAHPIEKIDVDLFTEALRAYVA